MIIVRFNGEEYEFGSMNLAQRFIERYGGEIVEQKNHRIRQMAPIRVKKSIIPNMIGKTGNYAPKRYDPRNPSKYDETEYEERN